MVEECGRTRRQAELIEKQQTDAKVATNPKRDLRMEQGVKRANSCVFNVKKAYVVVSDQKRRR